MSLDDEWDVAVGSVAPQETTLAGDEKVSSSFDSGKTDPASEEGLSLVVKLALAGAIFAACFAWVRARGSSRVGSAGRHGAYEKVGV